MSRDTAGSIARISVLMVLVIAALWGGGREVSNSARPTPTPETLVAVVPTATNATLIDLSTPVSTAPVTESTALPAPPTPVPTEIVAPSGRGTFPVPANTSGTSIVVERGPEDRMAVALTFDAGEGAGYTEDILELLDQYGIVGSFAVTGEWARAHPDLLNRILDEGHLVYNHSESHKSWTGSSPGTAPLTDDERTAEVMGAQNAVMDVADWDTRPFWRPPYGDLDAQGQELLKSLGYDYTFWWTCDTLAWMETTPEEIAARCASDSDFGGPGAIILMHVEQESDYLALEQIILDYRDAGYDFVPLNEMVGD